ncbi:hypothetical protein [Saccharopolyspora mangrovi]|uniref:Uncharacterized protein n=1 Tax=Saccharopolyspora mangrovi TaxID=3082379 RepID=A0ABU6AH05_9PSEU|nr:hypothetical protein [Saccharopolyspora sp. S2-29]MEB3370826.1 hypothetical protein [Saccharopolyspora sp. S2-29]
MRPRHPAFLHRLWWQSPLVVRLVPAAALIAATGAGVATNLPATGEQPHASPPQQPVTTTAPPTTPPPPVTTPAPTTTSEPTSSSPRTTRSTPRTTKKTTSTPPPPVTTTPTPTTTPRTTEQRPPGIAEGQPCDEPGDIGRGTDGERYVCDNDDGTWRWREW